MVVALENTKDVILEQVKLLITLFLVVHQCIARETRRHNVKGKDGRFCDRHWRGWFRTRSRSMISLRNSCCNRYPCLEETSCRYPALLRGVRIHDARSLRIALHHPPPSRSRYDHKCVATIDGQLRPCQGASRDTYTTTSNSSSCSAMYGYIATAYDISAETGTSLAGVPISL